MGTERFFLHLVLIKVILFADNCEAFGIRGFTPAAPSGKADFDSQRQIRVIVNCAGGKKLLYLGLSQPCHFFLCLIKLAYIFKWVGVADFVKPFQLIKKNAKECMFTVNGA